jgi:hypothetical protein
VARVLVGTIDTPDGAGVAGVAADDCGASGVIQIVKLDLGAEGASVPVVGALPVSLANPSLTAAAPTSASVGVASAEAVPVNANRKGLVLVNLSDVTISIAFGVPAVLNSGITMLSQGGSFTMTKDTFTTAQVRAIAGGAAAAMAIQEFST